MSLTIARHCRPHLNTSPSYKRGSPALPSGPAMIIVQCVIGSQLSRQQPSGGLRPQSVSSLCTKKCAAFMAQQRQQQGVLLVCDGLTNRQAAAIWGVRLQPVSSLCSNEYRSIWKRGGDGVHNSAHISHGWHARGYIDSQQMLTMHALMCWAAAAAGIAQPSTPHLLVCSTCAE